MRRCAMQLHSMNQLDRFYVEGRDTEMHKFVLRSELTATQSRRTRIYNPVAELANQSYLDRRCLVAGKSD
jgi:hypothetical protein